MITNSDVTIFHKGIDPETRIETWTRFYYPDCWIFESKGSIVRDGYQFNNMVDIRIPYDTNSGLNISNFEIGDIICKGNIQVAIEKQSDLSDAYNITKKNDNAFGYHPHIHLEGS